MLRGTGQKGGGMTSGADRMGEERPEGPRFWRRARRGRRPFMPFGFVPAGGLACLLLLGWSGIALQAVEGSTRLAAMEALAAEEAGWVRLSVSGQSVRLEGEAPSPEAGLRAEQAVRTARVGTWLGALRPAGRVEARFTDPPLRAEANSLSAGAARAPAQFLFRLNDGRLLLGGEVASAEAGGQLEAAARERIAPPAFAEVSNRLQATGVAGAPGYDEIALRAIEGLAACESGTASFADELFSFRCEADDEKVEGITARVRAGLPLGAFGAVEILPREAARSCESDLADLLEAARIEFAPGSSLLSVASLPVLDLAAAAATDCPGTLRIEGHTDSTGNDAANEALSLRRAEAVRAALIARGVPPARLIAAGFGAAAPVGDNTTEDGRARNRRIEIRIVRPVE